jgi:hypothetical protein
VAIQHKQRKRTVLVAALVVACATASTAAGQSSGCVAGKAFSPQDGGLHAVILGEWGADVAACDGTRAMMARHHPSRSRGSLPSNMRGRDQLLVPGWPNELPF